MSETEVTPNQADKPMSKEDFRFFNQLADKMDMFHNHFREMWETMWNACESGRRPKNMTLRQFLNHAEQFIHYLEVHHSIEEQVLYPQLAHKLSHFDPKNGALVGQHKEIHEGMDGLDKYIKDCKAGRADFSLAGLKEKMETWGDILWTHLDEEVEALGAAHIHKAFTREELMRIRM